MATKYYGYLLLERQLSGVVDSWDQCLTIVTGQTARYKGFKTQEEAWEWIRAGAVYTKATSPLPIGLFFDAGTGRKIGTEVRVVNHLKENQLSKIVPLEKINEFGNYVAEGKTNNYGELLGIYIALKIAIVESIMAIYGDSKLVLNYWSKGHYNREKMDDKETIALIGRVSELRKKFESSGGRIHYISGDDNPADLGFHKK